MDLSNIYLIHYSAGIDMNRILKILTDGYLYASYYTGVSALFGKSEVKYIYC
jgi:hypothetical protein